VMIAVVVFEGEIVRVLLGAVLPLNWSLPL